MAPLPQWSAGENKTGNWGGSTTGVTAASKHKTAAVKFATWMNTDTAATDSLITSGAIYPAASAAQASQHLQAPPAFFPQQADFYTSAKTIADSAAGFTWGRTRTSRTTRTRTRSPRRSRTRRRSPPRWT